MTASHQCEAVNSCEKPEVIHVYSSCSIQKHIHNYNNHHQQGM